MTNTALRVKAKLEPTFKVRRYSGRNMFGKYCLAIEFQYPSELLKAGQLLGANLAKRQGRMETDDMGLNRIAYWPNVEFPNTASQCTGGGRKIV